MKLRFMRAWARAKTRALVKAVAKVLKAREKPTPDIRLNIVR